MTDPSERFAVCEQVLRQGSFADDVAVAKAAGVSAIGVDANAVDATGAREARRILDSEGVGASSYIALESILAKDGAAAPIDEAARRLEAAASLGAPSAVVVTGSLGALAPAEADALCHDWLARAASIAAEVGIRIMLEPVHPLMRHLSFVHTLAHGLALVEGIDGAGVVFDLGHLWWERGLDGLIRDHVADIVSVQVTNVDSAALEDFRYERAPLDCGDVPVASLVRLLESAGYRGWYEEEVLVRSRRDQRLDLLRSSREWFERQVGTGR
jgi:sugar phosphate isomerase/epimerase